MFVANATNSPPRNEGDKPKSFLDRLTGTTAKVVTLLGLVTALMTTIPSLRTAALNAFCSFYSCSTVTENPQVHENAELKDARERIDRQRLYAIELLQQDRPDLAIT